MYSDVHVPSDASPVLSQADVTDVVAIPELFLSALQAQPESQRHTTCIMHILMREHA